MTMYATDDSIEVTKAEIKAILEHASKDETRPHLSAALFKLNGKATAVATDGHRLARCEVSAAGQSVWECLVPRDALERAAKNASAKDTVSVRPGRLTIGDVAVPFAENPEVKFPPYEQVIPRDRPEKGHGGVALNTAYLASLNVIGKAIDGRTPSARVFAGDGDLDPVVFEVGAGGDYPWTVVVMPMRQ
jgi:DNA polymerase III sliding clamp (beta) subunit (PCNA family)